MEDIFKRVVQHVFTNWYALKLAVEHSMGGPTSKERAMVAMDDMIKYLSSDANIESEDIEDVLEDIMEEDFNTACEDNSIKEVAQLLLKFRGLIMAHKMDEVEQEYNKLPPGNPWLVKTNDDQPHEGGESSSSSNSQENTEDEPMDADDVQDPGWTKVVSKRKH